LAEYYGDVDGFVPHSGGDHALCDLAALLPPRQLAARQISHTIYRLPNNSITKAKLYRRSILVQITRNRTAIVRNLSLTVFAKFSQPFPRAKPNHNIAVFCFVDSDRVLGFLVWEYLALVDEVIKTTIPYASDSCRHPCQVDQFIAPLLIIIGVMINLLK
jgi:hypothetical protein